MSGRGGVGRRTLVAAALWLAVAGVCGSARAGGFYLPDPGVVAQGRGGAFTATADELLGVLHNPAGLFQLDGLQIHLAGGLIAQSLTFDRDGGRGMYKPYHDGEDPGDPADIERMLARPFDAVRNDEWRIIPAAGLAYGLEEPDLTFGFVWYTPYALPNSWPEDGAQRYASVWSSSWQIHWSLFASLRVAPWLAVGLSGGVMLLRSRQSVKATANVFADEAVGLTPNDENPLYDIDVYIEAWERAKPWINGGVLLLPAPWLRVGVCFSPGFRMRARDGEIAMTADIEVFEGTSVVLDASDDIELEAGMPAILRTGVAVIPREGLTLELDFHVEFWSQVGDTELTDVAVDLTGLKDQLQAIAPTLSDEVEAAVASLDDEWRGSDGRGSILIERDFRDAWSLRFGAEGIVAPWLTLRGGCLFERTSIKPNQQTPGLPDADKFGLTVGATVAPPGVDVHLAWMHYFLAPVTVRGTADTQFVALPGIPPNNTADGSYRAHSDVVGLGVSLQPEVIRDAVRQRRNPYGI